MFHSKKEGDKWNDAMIEEFRKQLNQNIESELIDKKAERHLKKLFRLKLIDRKSSGPSTYYEIIPTYIHAKYRGRPQK